MGYRGENPERDKQMDALYKRTVDYLSKTPEQRKKENEDYKKKVEYYKNNKEANDKRKTPVKELQKATESAQNTNNTFIPLEDSNGRTQSELYRIKENNKTTSRVEKNIADRYRQRIEDTKKLFGNDLILPNDNDYLNITPEQVKSIIASKEAAIDWQRRVKPKSGTSPNYKDRYGKQHIIADLEDQVEKYKQYLNELNYNNLKNNSDYKKYVNQSKNGLLENFARQANQYNIDHTFFMTDEERNNYLYIYNKQGRKEARKYMEWLEPELNRRYSEDIYSTAERMGREHPVSSTGLSVLGSPLMAVSSGAAHIKNAITQNVDPYDPLTAQSKYSDVVRQSVMDNHIESDVGKFLYSAGTSLGDAAVNTIVAGAVAGFAGSAYGLSASATKKLTSAITTGLMSSPVAVSSALEAKARGKSDSEAVLIGSVYAGASWLTEKYSIERILNAKTLIGAIGTSTITEGSEEIAENWAGRIIDIFAYGDENQLTQSYNYYREQGFNETEAVAAVAKNILKEDAMSGAAGAIGGLGFAIGGAVGGYYNTGKSRTAQDMSENVVNGQENINNDTVTDTNPITTEQAAQNTQNQTVNNGQNTPFSNIQQGSAQNVSQTQNSGLDNNIPTDSYSNVNTENNFNNTANTVQNDIPKAADFNPDIATKMIKSHGENGAKAFETALQNERAKGNNISRYDFLRYFNKYYAAALVGKSKSTVDVNYSDRISQSSAMAAYTAGVKDKALELEKKIKAANNVTRQNGGVLINENSRLINNDTVSYINGVAKDLGVSVEFVDSVKSQGGQSVNGSYSDGTIKISMEVLNNPNAETDEVRNMVAESIFKHEITHRTQQLAPKQFEKFRDLAYEYVSNKNSSNLTEVEKQLLKEYESGVDMNYSEAVDEIVADFVGSADFAEHVAVKDKNLAQKVLDVIRDILDKIGVKKYSEMDRIARAWEKAINAAEKNVNNVNGSTKNTGNGKIQYSLSKFAERDVNYALTNKNYTEDVYLTESSPSIIVNQKGTKNLPMVMKASHIRENVFTEQEAANMGLKVDKSINYHGLGKELFLKIIDGLNDVTLAYRGTKNADNPERRENYFLLISKYKDSQGNTVNVPVFINEKGQYNRVFFDTNKIATVFGRNNFNEYINKEIKKGNLVRIKNRNIQVSELTSPINASYNKNASVKDMIQQETENVNSLNENNSENPSTKFSNENMNEENTDNQSNNKNDVLHSIKNVDDLIKENKRLEKKVDYLKSQMHLTEKYTPNPKDIKKIVKDIAEGYTGELDIESELKDACKKIGEFVSFKPKNSKDAAKSEQLWNNAREKISDISYDIVKNTLVKDDESAKMVQDVKGYLKGIKISIPESNKSDIASKYGSYNDFRRHNFGRFILSDQGVPIDVVYSELNSQFGNMFPDDIINPAEQAMVLNDFFDGMEVVYENPYSADIEAAVDYMANEIEMRLFTQTGPAKPTFADRQKATKEQAVKKAVDKERVKKDNALERAKEVNERAIEREREKRENAVERMKQSRDRYRQEIADRIQKNKNRQEQKRERNAREELLKLARRVDKRRTTPQNRAVIEELLKDIDLVSVSLTDNMVHNLTDLKDYYENQVKKLPNFVPDSKIEDNIKRLEKKHVADMDIEDVKDLINVLRNIENTMRTNDRLIDSEDRRNVHIQGEEVIRDIEGSKYVAKTGVFAAIDKGITGMLTPIKEIRRITGFNDNDPLYKGALGLQSGQTKQTDYEMRANKMFEGFFKDKKFLKDLSGKKANFETYTVTEYDRFGKEKGKKDITITPAMKISLYLHNMTSANQRHMTDGGVVLPNVELYKKGNIEEAYNSGEKVYLAPKEIQKITNTMTPQEKKFADAAYMYFNEFSKTHINEVSTKLDGYEKADVKDYFPISTDKNFTHKEFEALKHDGTIEGMGFLKERTDANNPIYLRDVNEVLEQAIRMHAKYYGLAIPVRNFNKLLNVQTSTYVKAEKTDSYGRTVTDKDGNAIEGMKISQGYINSVKSAIAKHWGNNALDYIENMMNDIQGNSEERSDGFEFVQKVTNASAAGVLTGNLPVALNQVAGLANAAYEIGWRPVFRAMFDFGKVDLNEISEYTPLQYARTQGKYDPTVADMRDSGMELPKALDWMTLSDALVTRKVYKMCEYYVRQNFKNLSVNTPEYKEKVAEVYERTMYNTQPNSTVMERPAYLRSDSLTRSFMMFKGEPLKNVNILYESVANYSAKRKQYNQAKGTEREEYAHKNLKNARKQLYRGLSSQVIGTALFTVVVSAAKFALGDWDKYKDEETGEYTKKSVLNKLGSDFIQNIITQPPFGSEIYNLANSLITGESYWENQPFTVSQINDITKSVVNISKFAEKYANKNFTFDEFAFRIYDILGTILQDTAGIPLKNWTKNLKALAVGALKLYNNNTNMEDYYTLMLNGAIVSKKTDDEGKVNYSASSKAYDILFNAFKSQDKEAYDAIVYDLIKRGVEASEIESKMRSRYGKTEGLEYSDTLGAYAGVKSNFAEETYEQYLEDAYDVELTKEQTKEGINIIMNDDIPYKDMMNNVKDFIDSNNFNEKQADFFIGIAEKQYKLDNLTNEQYKEYTQEYDDKANEIIGQVDVDTYDNQNEKNNVYKNIYAYAKAKALNQASDGDYVINKQWMIECDDSLVNLGYTNGKFIEQYNKYGKKVYSDDAKDAYKNGVSVDTFLVFWENTKDLKADKDKNGKSIQYSKQNKIKKVLQEMDATDEEKDYLYRTLYKTAKNNAWK